jgi:pyruvate/2-oxoglutarate dehydrogenase complex dihydrolipoamide acyltransferase (E2) component
MSGYEIKQFPKTRQMVAEGLRIAEHKHIIHGLVEVDVTTARRFIREVEARTGEQLSFTAFIISCVGKAVSEDKTVQAYRLGRNKLIVFNDVGVTTMVECTTAEGEKIVKSHIFKAADKKTYPEINREMQDVQFRPVDKVGSPQIDLVLDIIMALPGFLRQFFVNFIFSDPRRWQQMGATVGLSAVGMFGEGGGWGIPVVPVTLMLTLGGIAEKPGIVDGRIEPREYLSLTVSFDHDIVDGAPAARFTARLKQLIECGYGLREPQP